MKKPSLLALLAGVALLAAASPAHARPAKPSATPKPTGPQPARDDVVRLQIFLDEQNFGPGRIDGGYGGFTKKSWLRYQESQGLKPVEEFDASKFTSVDPIFTSYTVTKEDLAALGSIPSSLAEQAKAKSLPYTSMPELIGERYHVGVDFLKKLNAPNNLDRLKEGDQVKVPNVLPPFNLAQVFALRQYTNEREKLVKANGEPKKKEDKPADAKPTVIPEAIPGPTVALSASPPPADAVPSPSPTAAPDSAPPSDSAPKALDNKPVLSARPADSNRLVFHVNTKECYLEIRDGDRLVACFPITPGSTSIPTPKGNWKVVAKTLLPSFRWDKSVLMTGKRSNNAYELPPGPNNPVGITWVALDRPGIGMHGTSDPDSIGRSASHGCIRLSNWDAFKVYGMVTKGTQVIIE